VVLQALEFDSLFSAATGPLIPTPVPQIGPHLHLPTRARGSAGAWHTGGKQTATERWCCLALAWARVSQEVSLQL
jgi:hypothetical protein